MSLEPATVSAMSSAATRRSPQAAAPPHHVGYLVSVYPLISHTFIESEIRGLERLGWPIDRFSVRPCPQNHLLTDAMLREDERTTVLLDHRVRRTIPAAHLDALRSAPASWFAGMRRALRSGDRTGRARVWQVFYFAEAVLLLQHLRERGIHHVHVHFANVSADVARLAVHLGRLQDGPRSPWRWSMTMHGPTEFEAVDKVDLAAKVRSADGIMAISDFARSQLMRLVEPEHWDKMRVVRMSVDAERFAPPGHGRAGRDGKPFRVLTVGRLVPEKGSPLLLEALARMRAAGVEVEAAIIGSGPLESMLRARIQDLGLTDRVRLLGSIGQDAIVEHYHWADVFCLPSFQEGLPVVLMEALATELPVVTTRIAGIGELVRDGRSGHVIAPGRADLLAEALCDLAASPTARRDWGRLGRRDVLREFTPSATAPAMAEALAGVRSAAGAAGGTCPDTRGSDSTRSPRLVS